MDVVTAVGSTLPIQYVSSSSSSGTMEESDVFVLGDEEDDSEAAPPSYHEYNGHDGTSDLLSNGESGSVTSADATLAMSSVSDTENASDLHPWSTGRSPAEENHTSPIEKTMLRSTKYYIQPKDTIIGISLKFGVDVSVSQE
jgi:hypothetical protein